MERTFREYVDEVKRAAHGRWPGILAALGFPVEALENRHRPCPSAGRTGSGSMTGTATASTTATAAARGMAFGCWRSISGGISREPRGRSRRWSGCPGRAGSENRTARRGIGCGQLLQRIWDEAKPVEGWPRGGVPREAGPGAGGVSARVADAPGARLLRAGEQPVAAARYLCGDAGEKRQAVDRRAGRCAATGTGRLAEGAEGAGAG